MKVLYNISLPLTESPVVVKTKAKKTPWTIMFMMEVVGSRREKIWWRIVDIRIELNV